MYPDPVEQAKAVTVFGGMGAIGIGGHTISVPPVGLEM
jgi:hypothetical protein